MTQNPASDAQQIRRRAYLEAMGIHVYPPASRPGTAALKEAVSAPPAAVAKPLRQTVASNPSERPMRTVEHAPVSAPVAGTPDAETPVRFRLQFFRISEHLSVLDELPFDVSAGRNADVLQLLQAILQALGAAPSTALQSADTVCSWPMEGADGAAVARVEDARDMIRFFIKGRLADNPGATLLIFAGACADLLSDGDGDLGPGRQPGWLQQLGCRVILTHSLTAMLKVPALKKSAWQALRPLAGQIPG
ncbi:MAG: hypothetical protein RLZZ385_1070 [Pseudomonadota bacterium]|jgi:hypothetical protein